MRDIYSQQLRDLGVDLDTIYNNDIEFERDYEDSGFNYFSNEVLHGNCMNYYDEFSDMEFASEEDLDYRYSTAIRNRDYDRVYVIRKREDYYSDIAA